jgi:hypothetical protein
MKLVLKLHVLDSEFAKQDVQPTLYAYHDIKIATQDFHPDMKIGQGSFGVVYKVCVHYYFIVVFSYILMHQSPSIMNGC